MEAHGEDLRQLGCDEAFVAQLKRDHRELSLEPRQRAMIDFAVQVSEKVHDIDEARVDALREAGLSDEDVLNVVQVTGFFNYYNRMVDALGVQPEDFMPSQQ